MTAFCVVLQPRFWTNCGYARNKRFYLSAEDAERAMRLALDDNPEWRIVGVEPGRMSAGPSHDHPTPQAGTQHAA